MGTRISLSTLFAHFEESHAGVDFNIRHLTLNMPPMRLMNHDASSCGSAVSLPLGIRRPGAGPHRMEAARPMQMVDYLGA